MPAFHLNIFLKVLHRGIKINLFFFKDSTFIVMKINKNQIKQHVAVWSFIILYLNPGTFTLILGIKLNSPAWVATVFTYRAISLDSA